MLDGKTFPSLGRPHYVLPMCDGATLTRNAHFLSMRPTRKIIMPNIHMKACMLEAYMAMTRNHFFPKNHVPLIVAWMVYVEVVFGVQVNWNIVLGNRTDNVHPYQLDRFVKANPLTLLESHRPPITVPLVLTRKPWILPQYAPIVPPFSFQPIPQILVFKTTTLSTSCT
jgi:hypothetical protein